MPGDVSGEEKHVPSRGRSSECSAPKPSTRLVSVKGIYKPSGHSQRKSTENNMTIFSNSNCVIDGMIKKKGKKNTYGVRVTMVERSRFVPHGRNLILPVLLGARAAPRWLMVSKVIYNHCVGCYFQHPHRVAIQNCCLSRGECAAS